MEFLFNTAVEPERMDQPAQYYIRKCVKGGYDYYGPEAASELRYRARMQGIPGDSRIATATRDAMQFAVPDYSLTKHAAPARAMEPGGDFVTMSWNPPKFAPRR